MTEGRNNSWGRLLRTAAIVPVALLAGLFGHQLGGMFGLLRGTGSPEPLLQFLSHVPWGLAVVCGGAFVAPRRHVIVAVVLAICGLLLSLQTHILTQASPGLNHYLHWGGECSGLLLGIATTARWQRGRTTAGDRESAAADQPLR